MKALLPLSLAVTSLALCPGCVDTKRPSGRDAVPESESAMLSQRGKVTIQTRAGRMLRLDVEIASNGRSRERGLMFRRALPESAGMIFVFPEESPHSFWMMNTYLPLDMLFVDSQGQIVGIVENAEPLTTTPRAVHGESKYVLEVNGGWCARHEVAAGDRLDLEGMYDLQ